MRNQRGFTLLEILVSMSLFTIIGFAVVLLMRTGVDMWLRGSRGSQQEDRLEQSLPRLEDDLRMTLPSNQRDRIPFDPDNPDPQEEPQPAISTNRFISGYMTYRISDKEHKCRFLSFVRDITGLGEIETFASRAGISPAAASYIDGKNDEDEFKRRDHLPTGGAVEILWVWLPDDDEPGSGTVYRAYRTPIGGKETLLDPNNYAELRQIDKMIKDRTLKPVFQDVILFDIYVWTQFTTTWEWTKGEPSVTEFPQSASQIKGGRPSCGPSRTWDSTRGIMVANATSNSQYLPANCSQIFRLASKRQRDSAHYSDDDIWPRAVRVEFALAEETTELVNGVGTGDLTFTVVSGDFATGRGELDGQYMRLGREWVQIDGRDGFQRDTFKIARRGQRGTSALAHAAADPVYYGRIFDFTIVIPSFRDANN